MQLGQGRGTEGCSNVQTAVASKPKLLLACEVTNETSDCNGLSPMALQAQAGLACPFEVVADMGDYHGDAVQACWEAGITPDVARPITSANQQLGLFRQEDFRYEGATDTSQCPAGALLTCRFDKVAVGWPIRS
jgi:transposase